MAERSGFPPELLRQLAAAANATEDARRILTPAGEQLFRITTEAKALADRFAEQFGPAIAEYQRFTEQLAPVFARLGETLRDLPKRQRDAARLLAQHGWYVDPETGPAETMQWAASLARGPLDSAHEKLIIHFDSTAESRLDDLVERFPHRERFFTSAFAAHARGDYPCSVPLFLAQADGVCVELVNEQLYKRRSNLPALATALAEMKEGSLVDSLIAAIIEPTPLSASPDERKALPEDILNRHVVLHGESLTYDTRLNSSRAMSLLGFVAWALDYHKPERAR